MLGRRETGRARAEYDNLLLVPFLPRIIEHARVDVAVARQEVVRQLRRRRVLRLPRNKEHHQDMNNALSSPPPRERREG